MEWYNDLWGAMMCYGKKWILARISLEFLGHFRSGYCIRGGFVDRDIFVMGFLRFEHFARR